MHRVMKRNCEVKDKRQERKRQEYKTNQRPDAVHLKPGKNWSEKKKKKKIELGVVERYQ